MKGIRSERQLLRLAADRLSVRWYLGYNLDESLPDHSSLTRIRLRYGLEVFRRFFEAIVAQCQQAGLVWGRELSFDATQVQADAALDSLTARFAVEARQALQARQANQVEHPKEAVEAHLAALFSDTDPQQPPEQERTEGVAEDHPTPPAAAAANEANSQGLAEPLSLPVALPVALPGAQSKDLEATNSVRHDWIAQAGRQQRAIHGA